MIMNNLEVSAKIPIFADGNLKRWGYEKNNDDSVGHDAVIGQGAMINFVPNPKESMAKKQQSINAEVIRRATQGMGPNKGSSSSGEAKTETVKVNCSLCGGTGKVQGYGSPVCYECNGTGKKTKTRVKKAAGEQNAFDVLNDLWGM